MACPSSSPAAAGQPRQVGSGGAFSYSGGRYGKRIDAPSWPDSVRWQRYDLLNLDLLLGAVMDLNEQVEFWKNAVKERQDFIDDVMDFNESLLESRKEANEESQQNFAKYIVARQRLAIMAMRYAKLKKQIRIAS